MFDVLSAKDVVSTGVDVLDLEQGMNCQATFKGSLYDIEIVSKGEIAHLHRGYKFCISCCMGHLN